MPWLFVRVIDPAGIISASPSPAVKLKGPPCKTPPSASQLGPSPLSSQIVGLACSDQEVEASPLPLYSKEEPVVNAGTKSPVVQIPAATATLDR